MQWAVPKDQRQKSKINGGTCAEMRRCALCENRRKTQKTGGRPPPAPLSQTVADIVDLYKGCSSFVGVSGGTETPISKQTGVLFYNSNIMVKKLISTVTHPSFPLNPAHQFNSLIFQYNVF